MKVKLNAGVVIERVGEELLVVVPGNTDVVKLTDDAAEVLLDIQADKAVDLSHPAMSDLVALEIVSAPAFSRRGLIKTGAIAAGAGVAVWAMPSVASAASSPGSTGTNGGVGGNLFGNWSTTGDSRRLSILAGGQENVFPFALGDDVPTLTDLKIVGSSTVFSGTVTPLTVVQVGDNNVVVEWVVSAGNLDAVFDSSIVTGKFVFDGKTFTADFRPPSPR